MLQFHLEKIGVGNHRSGITEAFGIVPSCPMCPKYPHSPVPHHTQMLQADIPFVSYQHDDHIGVGVLSGILEPCRQVIKCVSSRNVIYQ